METKMPRSFSVLASRFVRGTQAVAAVEFAFILPLMVVLYLGTFEIVPIIAVKRLVTLTASTVANVTTQYASISVSTTMPDILNASSDVLTPYASSNATVVVSLITIDGTGKATVTWSQALNGAARTIGHPAARPGRAQYVARVGRNDLRVHADDRSSASGDDGSLLLGLHVAPIVIRYNQPHELTSAARRRQRFEMNSNMILIPLSP
jgi:Flp pilus assembly protein TadG